MCASDRSAHLNHSALRAPAFLLSFPLRFGEGVKGDIYVNYLLLRLFCLNKIR